MIPKDRFQIGRIVGGHFFSGLLGAVDAELFKML